MKHLVLVGSGNAHIHILKQLIHTPLINTKVTLIAPTSNRMQATMVEKLLPNTWQAQQARTDFAKLTRRTNVSCIDDHISRIDTKQNMIYTKKGLQLPYDYLSLNIGAAYSYPDIPGVKEVGPMIKPNAVSPNQLKVFLRAKSCAVVGNSVFAMDFALSLLDRRKLEGSNGNVYLLTNGPFLPELLDASKRIKLENWLKKRGIIPVSDNKVVRVATYINEQKSIYLDNENSIDVEQIAWLGEQTAHPILRDSGLGVDQHGFLMAGPTLQLVHHDDIFAAGACKTFLGSPSMDRTGLFLQQEAQVLWENIQIMCVPSVSNRKMKIFVPNRNHFAMFHAGVQQTVLLYRNWLFAGSWCWWLHQQLNQSRDAVI